MVRAILVDVKSWLTGERAYGINPRDPNLRALGGVLWQCLDHEPKGDWEIRLVLDDRPLRYEGKIILDSGDEVYDVQSMPADAEIVDVEGIIVLSNREEINAVLNHLPDKIYGDAEGVRRWIEKRKIAEIIGRDMREVERIAKKGHKIASERRKKELSHIVFGDATYAFLKRAHDAGCPHTRKAIIPKL